jgi:hypothetical protein
MWKEVVQPPRAYIGDSRKIHHQFVSCHDVDGSCARRILSPTNGGIDLMVKEIARYLLPYIQTYIYSEYVQ